MSLTQRITDVCRWRKPIKGMGSLEYTTHTMQGVGPHGQRFNEELIPVLNIHDEEIPIQWDTAQQLPFQYGGKTPVYVQGKSERPSILGINFGKNARYEGTIQYDDREWGFQVDMTKPIHRNTKITPY